MTDTYVHVIAGGGGGSGGTISLIGDVTGSGNGIISTTIASHAVTYAKFQQVAAVSLIGNTTGSLADATGITLGTSLTFSGSSINTIQAITTASSPVFAGLRITAGATTNYVLTSDSSGNATWQVNPGSTGITTLTGDVTASGSGTVAATIAANVVTYAKFQQVAAVSLIGNPTGSLANASGITLGTSLTFSGSTLNTIQDLTTASSPIFAAIKLTTGATNGYILTSDAAGNATWAINMGAAGITALTGDVTASGSGSVVATIAANAVTYAKFQQVAASSLVGNATGSLANATGITLGASLTFTGSVLNTIQAITTSSSPVFAAIRLTTGATNNYILTSDSSGNGTWAVNAALVSITALTGDVTASGPGSAAATITANIVTYAKFQQVAASSLVGNATGSLANATGITLGASLTFSGSSVNTVQAITTASSPAFAGLSLSGLTASQAVVTDGSKNLASLAFSATGGTSNLVSRDANGNMRSNNTGSVGTVVTSAAGTTTLTAASGQFQILQGSTTQTFQLPDATTLFVGAEYQFYNDSTGTLTVNNNGASLVATVPTTTAGIVVCTSIGTANGTWTVRYESTTSSYVTAITGTANQVIASASTGSITLSTPQDIATTSTVRFAKIGIGVAASNNQLSITGKASIGFGDTAAPSNGLIVSGVTSIGDTTGNCKLNITDSTMDSTNYGQTLQITRAASGTGQQIAFVRFGANIVSLGYLPSNAIFGFGAGTSTDASFSPTLLSINLTSGFVGVGTVSQQNRLDVAGAMAVGAYGGVNAAPTNGLIVSGFASFGTSTSITNLAVQGSSSDFDNVGSIHLRTAAPGTGGSPRLCFGIKNAANAMTYAWIQSIESGINPRPLVLQNSGGPGVGIGQVTPLSMLDVNGGVVIGAPFAGINTAPSNGLLVAGVSGFGLASGFTDVINIADNQSAGFAGIAFFNSGVKWTYRLITGDNSLRWGDSGSYQLTLLQTTGFAGFGTTTPQNRGDFVGSVAIGAYAGVNAAPTNGLIVSGLAGFGVSTPTSGYSITTGSSIYMGPGVYSNFAWDGGNSIGYQYGCFAKYGDGVHIGYNFYNDNTSNHIPAPTGATSRMSFGYGTISAFVGAVNTEPTTQLWYGNATGTVFGAGTTPANRLDVNGSVAIGTYANTNTAPTNGLIVKGISGIGTPTPSICDFQIASTTGISTSQLRFGLSTMPAFIFNNETAPGLFISTARDGITGTFPNTGIASAIIQLGSANLNSFMTFSTIDLNNTSPTERMRITNTGQIGIGASSPTAGVLVDILTTSTQATNSWGNFVVRNASTGIDTGSQIVLGGNIGSAVYNYYGGIAGRKENNTAADPKGYLVLATSNAAGSLIEAMRVTSTQQFGFGSTAPGTNFVQITPPDTTASAAALNIAGTYRGTTSSFLSGAGIYGVAINPILKPSGSTTYAIGQYIEPAYNASLASATVIDTAITQILRPGAILSGLVNHAITQKIESPSFGSSSNNALITADISVGFSSLVSAPTGGAVINGIVGIGTQSPVAKLEVVTASDTFNGGPSNYDNKYFTVGTGGAQGGSVYISFNQSTGTGFIGSLAPTAGWRTLVIQPSTAGNVGFATITPASFVSINGNVAIGTYAPTTAAPTNSLIISGQLGVATATPQNTFDVNGSAAFGTYGGVNAAPTNGIAVSGSVGIGVLSITTNCKLDVLNATNGVTSFIRSAAGANGSASTTNIAGHQLSIVGAGGGFVDAWIDNSYDSIASNYSIRMSSFGTFTFMSGGNGVIGAGVKALYINVAGNSIFGGSIISKYVATATSYTVTGNESIVGVTNTSSARTITLPASMPPAGYKLTIVDESQGAAINNITIARNGNTINGGTTNVTILTNGGNSNLYSNGTGWITYV